MSTAPCDRCGDRTPEPLLRRVDLRVDGESVDDQTLCPDCFAEWIARYRDELAGDMPQPEEEADVGDDITIAEETEPGLNTGSHAFDNTIASADGPAGNSAQSRGRGQQTDGESNPTAGRGNEIKEVGGTPPEGPGGNDGEATTDRDGEREYDDLR